MGIAKHGRVDWETSPFVEFKSILWNNLYPICFGASRGNTDITLILAGKKDGIQSLLQHIPEIRLGAGALSVSVDPVDPRFVPVITADCKLEENYKFDPSLGPLKCPVLVFYGTKDRVHAEVFCVTTSEGFHGLWRNNMLPRFPSWRWLKFGDCSSVVAVAYGRSSNGAACDQHMSLSSLSVYMYISYYIILRLRRANSSAFWKLLPLPNTLCSLLSPKRIYRCVCACLKLGPVDPQKDSTR